MVNATLNYALGLASQALYFYLQSDVCIKDLAYDEMYTPLKELVRFLQHATNGTTPAIA